MASSALASSSFIAAPAALGSIQKASSLFKGASAVVARAPASKTVQAVFGSKAAKSKALPKVKGTNSNVKAQTFKLTLPGVQSKNADGVDVTLGFTKSNELFVGRAAMLGFAATLIGEILTGKGAIAQFGIETGLPINEVEPLILGVIVFNLVAAFFPASGKFVPQEEDFSDRVKGALQDPRVSIADGKKFFGLSGGFGFTKENELFVGRTAQLGFAASLIGEAITGVGPLAQVGFETGLPLNETEPLLLFFIAFFLLAAINEGTGKFVDESKK